MDEEPEPPMPNTVSITSETTGLDVEARPPGGAGSPVELVLRLATMEWHTWLGIGGRTGRVRCPRGLISTERWLALDDYPSDDYRRLIGRAIKYSLSRGEEKEEYHNLSPARWDEAVPLGVDRDLTMAVQHGRAGGATFAVIVDISVHFEFVYSEPKALLLACFENGGGDLAGRSGDGEAPSCPICFEDMSREAGEVTDLPGCTHGFHTWCIASWFHKASTCPVCRRDQLQYLPLDYRDLHDKMTILPDYL